MGITLPTLTRSTHVRVPVNDYERLVYLRARVEDILDQDGIYRLALNDAEIIAKLGLVIARLGSDHHART